MQYYLLGAVIIGVAFWGYALFRLKRSVSLFARSWSLQNKQVPQQDALIYVVLGDSTAQGIGAPTISKSYPYLVSQWLQKQTGKPVHILNLSRSGATVAEAVSSQAPELYRKNAVHIVSVCIGSNNIKKFNAESFEKEMATLLRLLPKGSYVATVPHFGGRVSSHNWKARAAAESTLRQIAQTNHYAIDLYAATQRLGGLRFHAADLFHPNAKAYASWATAFEQVMAEHIPDLLQQK